MLRFVTYLDRIVDAHRRRSELDRDVRRLGDAGFDAVLVGEVLVTSPDPAGLVREFVSVG